MNRREWSPQQRIVLPVDATGIEVIRDVRISAASGGPPIDPHDAGESTDARGGQQRMDVYRPADEGLRPAVLFVYGDAPPEYLAGARRWGQYVSWGEAVAAAGLCAVVFDHASSEARTCMDAVIEDIETALDTVRQHGTLWGIDGDRLALWAGSAGVPYGTSVAMRTEPALRCLVAYYGTFDLRAWREETPAEVSDAALAAMSPILALETRPLQMPTLVVKAALDRQSINDSIDAFVGRARDDGWPVELVVHDEGRHGFDVLDDDGRSRQLIIDTIAFLRRHLGDAAFLGRAL